MQAPITVDKAESIIRKHPTTAPVESVFIGEAQGRYLRQEIVADRPLPPFDRVMMDGIAICYASYAAGNRTFPIAATQAAGAPPIELTNKDCCIEVMTGCVLPAGCDCVIPVEVYDVSGNTISLHDGANPKQDQHIHLTGSDTHTGKTLLSSGQLLNASELTIAASVGATELQVAALPRILVITTGDEVIAPHETPLPYQIRRSHATALHASITGMNLGSVDTLHVSDDPEALHTVLSDAIMGDQLAYDIILLTGGVSRGKYDYVAPVLINLLGAPLFHGIAQRPGKPMAFWKNENSPPIFALPGNPVSVMACAARYLFPMLRESLSGNENPPTTLPASGAFNCPPHFTGLTACRVQNGRIQLVPPSNSGNFLALAGTHGIAELPGTLARKDLLNEPATFYPWV